MLLSLNVLCEKKNVRRDGTRFSLIRLVQQRWKVPVVGLKVNTVGKTIKRFRTFLNNRVRKKIIAPPDLTGWTIPEEEVDAVYLNWEEVSKVYRTNLANFPHLADY